MSPLSNAYLGPDQLHRMEPFYPLHAWVCRSCFLVQLEEFESPERIFRDYAYFSSYSDSWLEHARRYAETMIGRFGYGPSSFVAEVGSNDGYLLQYFRQRGVPVLGIEPAANVAAEAERKGVPTLVKFFGTTSALELAAAGKKADLLIGNNVLAHVPGLNDFVEGMRILLAPAGVITMEFPHLLRLMQENQFDTIYHEHFSYFSFMVAERVFGAHRLTVFDVEELPTHGGSLRIFARHTGNASLSVAPRVSELRAREKQAGLDLAETYAVFAEKVRATKRSLLRFLIDAKESGKRIAGYGAPAKGNTCSTTAACARICWNIRWTAARTSRAIFFPARIFRSMRRRRSAKHGRTTCSSCRGISRTRSSSRWPTCEAGVGGSSSLSPKLR
jgi:SAM-dependent methyltransferase